MLGTIQRASGEAPAGNTPDQSAQTTMTEPAPEQGKKKTFTLGRIVPLALLVVAFVAFFAFDLDDYVSFSTLQEHRQTLIDFVARYGVWAALLFIVIYAISTAVSLPGGTILTISGGFLFGSILGTVYVVIGATIGATALFLAARTALGEPLRARAGPALKKMEEGFRDNAISYLLVLRLVPIFPFFVVNLVPAFLGVSIKTYVICTFVGIIPGSFVYASVGNGLGALFDAGETPDLYIIFEPDILIPLIGLSVLALIPVIYKKIKGKDAIPPEGGT
ncbi:MAG TPA: TVP38/TMEM64 family protein [Alphaproteobacteria bacterium]|nr:TVP38/TMEM64 family protein [Alphaproteobacteria bacterium]